MTDLRPQYNEEAVGANHPTKTDIINRAYDVEHDTDGTHKAAARTSSGAAASGANADITSMTGLDDDGIPGAKVADVPIYTSGTCTVAFTAGTGTITIDTNYDTLSYEKIGDTVFIRGHIQVNSVSSPSGQLLITGLPYTSADLVEQSNQVGFGSWVADLDGAVEGVMGRLLEGSTQLILYEFTGMNVVNMADHCQANTSFSFNFHYRAA